MNDKNTDLILKIDNNGKRLKTRKNFDIYDIPVEILSIILSKLDILSSLRFYNTNKELFQYVDFVKPKPISLITKSKLIEIERNVNKKLNSKIRVTFDNNKIFLFDGGMFSLISEDLKDYENIFKILYDIDNNRLIIITDQIYIVTKVSLLRDEFMSCYLHSHKIHKRNSVLYFLEEDNNDIIYAINPPKSCRSDEIFIGIDSEIKLYTLGVGDKYWDSFEIDDFPEDIQQLFRDLETDKDKINLEKYREDIRDFVENKLRTKHVYLI
jgi:hypothetical protein